MKILQRNINHNSEKINSLNYAYNIFIDEQESLTLDNKLKSIDIDITKNIENIKLNNNAIVNHTTNNQNPHNVTKTQIGLSNVDNTADAVKNVLSASKLTNARNITIGNSNKLFNGTGDLNYSLAEIGASDVNHKHNLSSITEAGFMRALSNNTSHFMRGDGTWVTPPDTKYGVANTTTLGLIKSGGDITVNSSGIVSVNDNSHKHSDSTITSLSSSKLVGQIPIELIPKAALERLITVENKTARLALTNDRVQTGDTVQEIDTGVMYVVIDDTKLNSEAGYKAYTAASASSVPWSGITGKPSSFVPSSHTHTKDQVGLSNVDNTADSVKNVLSATKLATARNITIGSSTKSFNGTANVSYSLSEIGAAASSHSHSNYLPLAGGTMTGKLTANGKIKVNVDYKSWLDTKTTSNAGIDFGQANTYNFYPFLSGKSVTNHTVSIGNYSNSFSIVGILSNRTTNQYDWMTNWDMSNGNITHSSNISANQFIGSLNGNASTATKLATARNITIGGSTKTFDGSGNISYTVSEIGAAATSHSHSNYLPLAGGTMTGKLTANGRIKTSLVGGSWLNSKTTSNAGIDFGSWINNGTYYPFFAGTSISGHTVSVGGIANTFNIVGILSDTTENGLQWRTYWDINNGNIYHSNMITAAQFTGPLSGNVSGNASTATKLATARNITIGSSTKAFDGSANISFSLSEIGAAASSHTHTKAQVGLGNVDNTADSAKNVLSASKLTTARNITIGSSTKSFNGTANVSYTLSEIGAAASSHTHTKAQVGLGNVDNTADSAKNVLSASKLTTARSITIGNTTKTFDGSSDIEFTLSEVGANSSNHTHTKAQVGLGNVDNTADSVKNVLSATKLTTARNITIGSSTKSFNGTANVSYSLSEIGAAASSHTHTKAQVGLGNVDNTADASKNVLSATKLTTARNIKIGNISKSFNGTADMNYTLSEIGAASSSHTHNSLEAESLANQTISLNTLKLVNEDAIIRYYYCPTNGTGANITGRPDDTKKYAFLLKVEKLRNSSSSDYVTKQTYIDYSATCTYERYCSSGTWSAWYKVYTSKDKPTLSELGAAAASHSHSNYLPLAGGTMTGKLTANGRIKTSIVYGTWLNSKTTSNAGIDFGSFPYKDNYYPFFAGTSLSGHTVSVGGMNNSFNIVGILSDTTENKLQWRTDWDINTGNIIHSNNITAAQFIGPLSGNASTATKLATARNITIGSSTKAFDGLANISFSLSEIGAAATSHTHTKSQVGLSNVDNTADASKNVLSATKLTNARNITIGSSTKSFNGTANVSYSLSEIGAASSSHTHNSLEAESLAGKTISLNTLTLNTGTPSVKYYDCYSDGDGANITGRPNDNLKYSFILKVESIRCTSTTDYVTKQTFIDTRCITYERYCKSGNWTAWSKVYNSSDLSAADKSELTNLVLNGDGKLGKTIGWENHTFSTDAPLGAYGSFIDGYSDKIYVNFNQGEVYDLSFYLKNKSGNTGVDYFAMIPYDSEGNIIDWYLVAHRGLTKLTKDLNNGDTVIYCEDLSKWDKKNADTYTYWRHIGYHDYTNKNGYTYPPGTYTRNMCFEAFANGSSIDTTNNTITLKQAWSRGTKKAGTYIAQHYGGSSRIYFGLVGKVPPAEWTKYEIKSISKSNDIRLPYTASIRFYMLNKKAMISNLVFKRQAATLSDIDTKINNITISALTDAEINSICV